MKLRVDCRRKWARPSLTIHETFINMNIFQTEKKLGPTKATMERPTHEHGRNQIMAYTLWLIVYTKRYTVKENI